MDHGRKAKRGIQGSWNHGKRELRVREKITSQNWRSDLVQVWPIRESKTTGIASYFEDFASEVSAKDGLKVRCKNVKLFLREPLSAGGDAGIAMRLLPIPTKTGLYTGGRCYSISCQQDGRDLLFLFLPV
jgi:hypothetical protein